MEALKARDLVNNKDTFITAPYFIDATELGDILPLTGTEYVTGSESQQETNELHAAPVADPQNQQAITFCLAMQYLKGENHTINKPLQYDFWRNYIPKLTPPWPGKLLDLTYSNPSSLQPKKLGFSPDGAKTGDLLNLWNYRRIIDKNNFNPGAFNRRHLDCKLASK